MSVARKPKKVGDKVHALFDDGWHGAIIYGTVIQAGPKTYMVEWESSIRNRLAHDNPHVVLLDESVF